MQSQMNKLFLLIKQYFFKKSIGTCLCVFYSVDVQPAELYSINFSSEYKGLLTIILVVFFFFALLIYWNRRLAHEVKLRTLIEAE